MKKTAQGLPERLTGKASPLENCEMHMQSKKEGQRVTDLLAMVFYIYQSFCWIKLTKYSVSMKNGSLHFVIASCPCAFHFPMFLYVIEATTVTYASICYIVCVLAVKTLFILQIFPIAFTYVI